MRMSHRIARASALQEQWKKARQLMDASKSRITLLLALAFDHRQAGGENFVNTLMKAKPAGEP